VLMIPTWTKAAATRRKVPMRPIDPLWSRFYLRGGR
jgi:hypothetical protein